MSWLIWAFFKDDDNGPYGIYEATWWGAVKWWFRNPMHNLWWHVLAWPGGPFLKLGGIPGWTFYIGFRPPEGVFGIKLTYETGY